MIKAEFAARVAAHTVISKAAAAAVIAVFSAIADALAHGEVVTIAGFGTLSTKSRPARLGRNPWTGESNAIPASNAPSFKAGNMLHAAVT